MDGERDYLVQSYQWTAPLGVTHVMVEMWGGGGGSGFIFGGGGGGYARSFVVVTPSATYDILVGGGGSNEQAGFDSRMNLAGQTLVVATGGDDVGFGGTASANPGLPSILRDGGSTVGPAGAAAFGATCCPGPDGDHTGKGANFADPFGHAFPGYVLLTW